MNDFFIELSVVSANGVGRLRTRRPPRSDIRSYMRRVSPDVTVSSPPP